MPRPIAATINCKALKNNFSVVRKIAPQKKIWSVLKGNGYGHGLENVFYSLLDSDGFAVLGINDAVLLRNLGWVGPILLIEGFFSQADLKLVALNCITTVVHSIEQVRIIKEVSGSTFKKWLFDGSLKLKKKIEDFKDCSISLSNVEPRLNIYLKMNTGMNRLGFKSDVFRNVWHELKALDAVGEITLMTHFSCADKLVKGKIKSEEFSKNDTTFSQLSIFKQAVKGLLGQICIANSAAILWTGGNIVGDWIRPGIILYGASPSGESQDILPFNLQSVMTLRAEIISIQEIEPGETVGYGATFRAEKKMRIGVVACGYADGYPRHANSSTPVWVNGTRTHIVGRISMDMLTINLTNCPNVGVGTMVELWGANVLVDDVAKTCSTIGYELLTAITPRVPLFLINN